MILDTKCDMTSQIIPDMPTEEEIVHILLNSTTPEHEDTSLNSQQLPSQKTEVTANQACVVICDLHSRTFRMMHLY